MEDRASPPVVKPGDVVRLLSPGSYPEQEWLDESVAVLERWGLRVEVGAHAMDRFGFCAGTDEDRLADLDDAFRDPDVRAIITTRGGAGAYRIADGIDFDAVRHDPKPVVGFSDVTYLHLALWHHCRVPSIHGALAGATAQRTVRQLLMSTEALEIRTRPDAVSARVHAPGRAVGPLIGGNLTAVATSVGVRLPNLDGAILFLEDQKHKGLGFVDRLLTQLLASHSLDGIAAIALGSFEGFRDVADRGWTVVEVLTERLGHLGVPILGGLPSGHDLEGDDGAPDQIAVPLGVRAELDADAGTLIVQAPAA